MTAPRPAPRAVLLLPLLALLLLAAPAAATEIGPPLRLLTAGESHEELLFQGSVGYDARTYDGSGSFGDVDAERLEGEVRAILPVGGGWEVDGMVGLWRLDTPLEFGGISEDVTAWYPVIGGGVRALLWQDNSSLGWRVGVAADFAWALYGYDSDAVSGTRNGQPVTVKLNVDKPWEVRLALPVSRVIVPAPYLKGDWIAIDSYVKEYYGGPFLRMNRLPLKARGENEFGDPVRASEDLSGSSLPGLFGGVRWVRRVDTGERSFGLEAQVKDGFWLGVNGSVSF